MTQGMIVDIAAFVAAVGTVLYARLRRPACVVARRENRERVRARWRRSGWQPLS